MRCWGVGWGQVVTIAYTWHHSHPPSHYICNSYLSLPPLPCFTYLVHSDQHHLPSMIMFTQQITSLHAYSQDFLPPLSCFAFLAQCDHHHLTSSIIIAQLLPMPCFVYHGQPYHHPSFLYHVLMCATTRAKIKIPFCCSSSFPLRYGLRRSWGGLGASWGGRAILTRLHAVLGPRTSSCSQKWPSWNILGQS